MMPARGHAVAEANAGALLHDSRSRRVGVAPMVKTLIVMALCGVSCWRRQDHLARVVRWIWPGFADA